uniref:Uncharacterized protein n=1 Tax=Knipowitschia caucasica TaxID=637954 RepID=A0AAV2J149_KNICA
MMMDVQNVAYGQQKVAARAHPAMMPNPTGVHMPLLSPTQRASNPDPPMVSQLDLHQEEDECGRARLCEEGRIGGGPPRRGRESEEGSGGAQGRQGRRGGTLNPPGEESGATQNPEHHSLQLDEEMEGEQVQEEEEQVQEEEVQKGKEKKEEEDKMEDITKQDLENIRQNVALIAADKSEKKEV